MEELSSGQLLAAMTPSEAPPTQQATPTSTEVGEGEEEDEEDFDLEEDEEINLDDLDLNTDVSACLTDTVEPLMKG